MKERHRISTRTFLTGTEFRVVEGRNAWLRRTTSALTELLIQRSMGLRFDDLASRIVIPVGGRVVVEVVIRIEEEEVSG